MSRKFTVLVIGLGRIGLPLALLAAKKGNLVYGVEKNQYIINSLKIKRAPFKEPLVQSLINKYLGISFFPVTHISKVPTCEIVIITIGTSFDINSKQLGLDEMMSLFDSLIKYKLIKDKLIIIRTTVPIGTTDKIKIKIEESTKLVEGRDFFLVYCPERFLEGKAIYEEIKLPKIVGAYNEKAYKKAYSFLKIFGGRIIRVSSPKVAEFIKLSENSWRQLRFAFSNDIALLAEELGLDIKEIINAMNFKYPRNNIPMPSYGVSGYCLTKDPFIFDISFKPISKRRGFNAVWHYGRLVNNYMVKHLYFLIKKLINTYKNNLKRIHLLILGLSYKADIDDFRYSHAIDLIRTLLKKYDPADKLNVYAFDPYTDYTGENPYSALPQDIKDFIILEKNFSQSFYEKDIVVITVPHRIFINAGKGKNLFKLIDKMRKPAIVIDCWNIWSHSFNSSKDNIVYWGVGRGLR